MGSFWKFRVVVEQKNGKEMYKKGVLLLDLLIFFAVFFARRRLALHYFPFYLSKLYILD